MALDRLERGNFSAVKGIGAGLFELRMDFGPGYRIYLGKDGEVAMVTTRKYSETVKADLQNDPAFRRALLTEVVEAVVSGDMDTGKSVLRTYVNATIGFIKLGAALGKSPKSLMRMLSPTGNPQMQTFCQIVAYLQKVDNTVLMVHAIAA